MSYDHDDDLPPNLKAAQAAKRLMDRFGPGGHTYDPDTQAVVSEALDAARAAREADKKARDLASAQSASDQCNAFRSGGGFGHGAPSINRTFGVGPDESLFERNRRERGYDEVWSRVTPWAVIRAALTNHRFPARAITRYLDSAQER